MVSREPGKFLEYHNVEDGIGRCKLKPPRRWFDEQCSKWLDKST
jgi:hypothetical protein